MGKPVLILVAGGTASGKTTVVDKLLDIFGKKDISVIYMDNYYKERNDLSLEERKKINYDHPNSFDMEQLSNDLRRLMNGETIYTPLYDFANHNRNSEITIKVDPTKVIILGT
ncbi:MAG: hypothetical protein E7176_06880 [Erysipelotrichaceae bacterium]|nr:hypothetical protein [Erysipelotrichaceae bacterium]